MSIADRSLSRLRGSPLPGAGCLGPGSYVGCIVLPDAVVQVLRLALARLFCRALLRRLWPPVRFGVGCAAWDWAGCVARRLAWVLLSCWMLLRRLWPPVRFWVAVPLGIGLGACHRLAWVRLSWWVQLRRHWPPGAFGLAVPL